MLLDKLALVFTIIVVAKSQHIRRNGGANLRRRQPEPATDFQNFFTSTTTQKPSGLNYEQFLNDPGFVQFLEGLKDRQNQQQQQNSEQISAFPTTTTTDRSFNLNFPNNPFFQEQQQEIFTRRPQNSFVQLKEPTTGRPSINIQNNPFLNSQAQNNNRNSFATLNQPSIRVPQQQRQQIQRTAQPQDELSRLSSIVNSADTEQPSPVSSTQDISPRSGVVSEQEKQREEELFQKQAQSAKYAFASAINDDISQSHNERQEVREGGKVKGKYSYSDGFFKRTVEYEADDKGYRVVGEKVEEIGQGPQLNPGGQAKVATYVGGNAVKYTITEDDIQKKKPMNVKLANEERVNSEDYF